MGLLHVPLNEIVAPRTRLAYIYAKWVERAKVKGTFPDQTLTKPISEGKMGSL